MTGGLPNGRRGPCRRPRPDTSAPRNSWHRDPVVVAFPGPRLPIRTAGVAAATLLVGLGCGAGDPARGVLPAPFEACADRPLPPDMALDDRRACRFRAGDPVSETLAVPPDLGAQLPITHVVIRMQENRSFDHYLGRLSALGRRDVDGLPPDASNPDPDGAPVAPFRLSETCLEADPPHQWDQNLFQVTGGDDDGEEMDGFVQSAAVFGSDGRYVMGYYDDRDLPFYYWLAEHFALSDAYFSASIGGTWSNRNFLYMASAHGVRSTFDAVITEEETLFDQLDRAGVPWGVYTDGNPRQDAIGWTRSTPGVFDVPTFLRRLRNGTLEPVTFVDTPPWAPEDEHPPNDVQVGEAWLAEIYDAALASPLWPGLALILNYDNGGGMYDHVPPPAACVPTDAPRDQVFDRYGPRTPFILVSPWARPGYVSHVVHSHTSVVRFIQALHGLPAMTHRDANASALLDLFDFTCPPPNPTPPPRPAPGRGGCPSGPPRP